jgi:HEAT repeat protein
MMRDFAAQAIAELSADRSLPALLGRLRDGDANTRLQAVFDLGDHTGPQAEEAVETAAFTEQEPVVRAAALDALFARRGLLLDAESFRSRLDFIRRRVLSPLPSVRVEAEAELRELLARLAAGDSRRQLGLAWRADRKAGPLKDFVRAVFGGSPAEESLRYQELKASGVPAQDWPRHCREFNYARLTGLTGRERTWLEDVLLSQLDQEPDAVRAVALLGVQRAIQPLRELLPITQTVPAADVEAALRQLVS